MTDSRIPPCSIEAEASVLGGLMLSPESFYRVSDILREDDFSRAGHRLIYRAISQLVKDDVPFDSVTMGEWFEAKGLSEQIGGTGYLIDLSRNTPSAANIRAYATIVREKAVMRQLIEAGTKIVNMGFQPENRSADELLAESANQIASVIPSGTQKGSDIRDIGKATIAELAEQYERGDAMVGLPTGFPDLDEILGGLLPGRVYGIGARAKMGKTTLADNIADYVADNGFPVAKWSLEMSEAESFKRSLCAESGINNMKMLRPSTITEDEWPKISAATKKITHWPLTVFAGRQRVTIERIEAQASQLHAQGKLKLIVIDYLGLMELPAADRHDLSVGAATGRAKSLAVKLGVPVILVFQLNRGNEAGGQVRPPRPSDARDSGHIEQDLDVMILLHRPNYYDENLPAGVRCDIALNRLGPRKVIRLEDNLFCNRFLASERPWSDGAMIEAAKKAKKGSLDEGFGG